MRHRIHEDHKVHEDRTKQKGWKAYSSFQKLNWWSEKGFYQWELTEEGCDFCNFQKVGKKANPSS